MINQAPLELLIQQFLLTQKTIKSIDDDDLVNICVYASICFDHIERFICWWNIPNIGIGGASPACVANQAEGFKKISAYLISMAYQIDDWDE